MTKTMTPRARACKRNVAGLTALLLAIFLSALASPARAHEVRPAIADLRFDDVGGYSLTIQLNLEARLAGIGPEHTDTKDAPTAAEYDRLRGLDAETLRIAFNATRDRFLDTITLKADGQRIRPAVTGVAIPPVGDVALARYSRVTVAGILPQAASSLSVAWAADVGAVALRVRGPATAEDPAGPVVQSAYLRGGQESPAFVIAGAVPQSAASVFAEYAVVGFTHILPKGLDHILFVVGLFLLSVRFAPLAWQVTSFTVAHTATLALGMLGIVNVSPAIVEPLIAASIVYVGVENVLTNRLQRWRPVVVFAFGLLHGLGFAGVLTEIGLGTDHFVTGLIAFNIGVEAGQLAVIAACFLGLGLWFRHKPWYRSAITVPASIAIALVGAWWSVERVLG